MTDERKPDEKDVAPWCYSGLTYEQSLAARDAMTDERMTQGDVRLREELAAVMRCCDDHCLTDVDDLVSIVAARVGEAKREAWDEGYDAGDRDARAVNADWPDSTRNPYAALRAADAPLSDVERDGGHGGAGGEERASEPCVPWTWGRCGCEGDPHPLGGEDA